MRNTEPLSPTHLASAITDTRSMTLLSSDPHCVITPLVIPSFYCVLFISLLIRMTFILIIHHFVAILARSWSPSVFIGWSPQKFIFMPDGYFHSPYCSLIILFIPASRSSVIPNVKYFLH